MSNQPGQIAERLNTAMRRHMAGAKQVLDFKRLSGGANLETWSFDLETDAGTLPCILRRAPSGKSEEERLQGTGSKVPLSTEATAIKAATDKGVRAPIVHAVLEPQDGLGAGFIMNRIEGETIARKILRDDEFKDARPLLAKQCGAELARIHAIDVAGLPPLKTSQSSDVITANLEVYDSIDEPHPVFEAAFQFLKQRVPKQETTKLVHGDFRHGNLMIGPDGLRAVLDWEGLHIGDPMEDLGWLCVTSWRFGNVHKPVGGFGELEDLFEGYESAGGTKVDAEHVHFWIVMGTLRWGIICMQMKNWYLSGFDPKMERAAIGRRASETEIDLMLLLEEA